MKQRPPAPPVRGVPHPSEWGRIVVARSGPFDASATDALAAVEEAIASLAGTDGEAACRAWPGGRPAPDAVGFWRRSGGERMIHRLAGLSKPMPPVDPFRRGSTGDAAIRCEQGLVGKGPNPNPVRCELLHDHARGSTSIAVTTMDAVDAFAPGPDASRDLDRAMSIALAARSVLLALAADGPDAGAFAADAVAQAVDAMGEDGSDRDRVQVFAPSPLCLGRTACGLRGREPRPGPHLALPAATAIMLHRDASGTTSIAIQPAAMGVARSSIDPMARLRAHARIAELGRRSGGAS